MPAGNSTFAIGGVTCFNDTFVVKKSAVLRMNICVERPAHRKSAKRWRQVLSDRANMKHLHFEKQFKLVN